MDARRLRAYAFLGLIVSMPFAFAVTTSHPDPGPSVRIVSGSDARVRPVFGWSDGLVTVTCTAPGGPHWSYHYHVEPRPASRHNSTSTPSSPTATANASLTTSSPTNTTARAADHVEERSPSNVTYRFAWSFHHVAVWDAGFFLTLRGEEWCAEPSQPAVWQVSIPARSDEDHEHDCLVASRARGE